MPKAPSKKSSKSKKAIQTTETPKPTIGFFGRLKANKTLGNVVVTSANLISFSIKKVLNMSWIAITFSAIFFTPLYKALETEMNSGDKDDQSETLEGMIDQ